MGGFFSLSLLHPSVLCSLDRRHVLFFALSDKCNKHGGVGSVRTDGRTPPLIRLIAWTAEGGRGGRILAKFVAVMLMLIQSIRVNFACFERLYLYIQNFQGDEDCGNTSLVHPPFVSRRRRRWLIEQVLLHLRRRNRRRGILSVFLSPLNSSFELRRGPSPPPPSRSLVPFLSD